MNYNIKKVSFLFIIGFLSLILVSCTKYLLQPPRQPVSENYAETIARDARFIFNKIQGLEARVRLYMEPVPENWPSSLDGILFFRPPSTIRFKALSPFGNTIFDYLGNGKKGWVYLPKKREVIPVNENNEAFGTIGLIDMFDMIFSKEKMKIVSSWKEGKLIFIKIKNRKTFLMEIFEKNHLLFRAIDNRGKIELRNYKKIDNHIFPLKIIIKDIQDTSMLEIRLSNVTINPHLTEKHFSLQTP